MSQYYVAERGESRGPFSLEQISQAIRTGGVAAHTLMWRDGMAHWDMAEQVLAGTGLFSHARLRGHHRQDLLLEGDAPLIAAYGRRFAAFTIDLLVLCLPMTVLLMLPRAFLPMALAQPAGILLCLIALLLYFTVLQGRAAGATLGKRALGIRVVRDDGSALGDRLALTRGLLLLLSGCLLVPGLWPLGNRLRRGLHDMACGTVVIEDEAEEPQALDLEHIPIGGWSALTWVMAGLSLLPPVAVGVAATLSIPAYQEYVVQSKVAMAVEQARDASERSVAYHREHGRWPLKPGDIGLVDGEELADIALLHLDGNGTVALTFTSDVIRGRALSIRIGSDGHRQCITNLPGRYTDRACSRGTLGAAVASAQLSP